MKIAICTLDDNDNILNKHYIGINWDKDLEVKAQKFHEITVKRELSDIIYMQLITQISADVIFNLIEGKKDDKDNRS